MKRQKIDSVIDAMFILCINTPPLGVLNVVDLELVKKISPANPQKKL